MARNVGVLTSKQTPEAQEMYTPYYTVEPLLKYVPKDMKIWCPFDQEWSAFYQTFKQNGYDVVRSHIAEGGELLRV